MTGPERAPSPLDPLERVTAGGGEVIELPYLHDGVRWPATVGDPAGNLAGLVQDGPR